MLFNPDNIGKRVGDNGKPKHFTAQDIPQEEAAHIIKDVKKNPEGVVIESNGIHKKTHLKNGNILEETHFPDEPSQFRIKKIS